MFGITPTIWLIVQIALACVTIVIWFVRVLPNLYRAPQPRLLLEVWAPVALIVPVLCGLGFVGTGIHEQQHWMPTAGVVLAAMCAVGVVLLRNDVHDNTARRFIHSGFAGVVWTIAGIMLLMLAAADVLTVIVGQCVFAVAAILLWMNTPSEQELATIVRADDDLQAQRAASIGMLLIVVIAIGHGIAVVGGGQEHAFTSAGIALGTALLIMIATSIYGPATGGLRLAGWTASLGVLFAIGVLSMLHMLPHAIAIASNGKEEATAIGRLPSIEVARGFAAVAPEAAGLIAVGLLGLVGDRLSIAGRRAAGAILALVSVCLLLWRLL